MLEDPEQLIDDLVMESSLLAMNLNAGMLASASSAQTNAVMRDHAQTAEKLAAALRDEVNRRRQLEQKAKSGLYLRGADHMADALVRAEHNAKQSRHWLDAAAVEKRGAEVRKAYNRAFNIKLALVAGCAAAITVVSLYAFRRAAFYSLAGSVLLWGAAGLLLMAAIMWTDLTRRQKDALKQSQYWFDVSASETRKAEELAERREARLEQMRAEAEAAGELEDDEEEEE